MCGEEDAADMTKSVLEEIPPRVWRRASAMRALGARPGNTSACAEKSGVVVHAVVLAWKYLRVCGEEVGLK